MFPILLLIFMLFWLLFAGMCWVGGIKQWPITYFIVVLSWCLAMAPHLKPLFN